MVPYFRLLIYIIHVLGYGVPVGFFTGFSFIPPLGSRKDSRMGRRRRDLLSDTGPLRLIAGSLTFPQNGALT